MFPVSVLVQRSAYLPIAGNFRDSPLAGLLKLNAVDPLHPHLLKLDAVHPVPTKTGCSASNIY
jgi:hypothetical protein